MIKFIIFTIVTLMLGIPKIKGILGEMAIKIYNLVRKTTAPCTCGCKDFKRVGLNVSPF